MVIELPTLPYGYADLEPHMSERTLSTHHAKHHAAYVNNTVNKIKDTELEEADLGKIIAYTAASGPAKLDPGLKRDIFNNSAQAFNHQFFWHCMSPSGGGRSYSESLGHRIERDFGSYESFLSLFKDSAVKHFGSGWCWLVWDIETKKLTVMTTSNADTPISGHTLKPMFVIDVWEHAYYLDHLNQRTQFVNVFCDHLINWKFINERWREVSE